MDRTDRRAGGPFEYRELVIPLALRLAGSRSPTDRELAAFHGEHGILLQHLDAAAREGWMADEAADWDSLMAAGRFATVVEPDEGAGSVTTYTSVTIRRKRFARGRQDEVVEPDR